MSSTSRIRMSVAAAVARWISAVEGRQPPGKITSFAKLRPPFSTS